MSDGTFDPMEHPIQTGDINDDDPAYMDQIIEPVSGPPDMVDAPRQVSDPTPARHVSTRLLATTQTMDVNTLATPIILAPADQNRTNLTVRVSSASGNRVAIRMGSSPQSLNSPLTSYVVDVSGSETVTLSGHDGALWAWLDSGDVARISVVGVTK